MALRLPTSSRHRLVLLGLGLAAGLGVAACSSEAPAEPQTLAVPGDFATIQDAVDAANPGDLVLIAAGTYAETVEVTRPGLTIRGEDRNEVVLDGGDSLPNGFAVTADGVAIENLTLHGYTQNGVLFNGLDDEADADVVAGTEGNALEGYRVSYVTAYNNGLYGVYAFAAHGGLIEHTYVSGHPDSGLYIGQCQPCDAVVRDVTAENNAIGYYGTNASQGIIVAESTFRGNRLGMAPNSQDAEKLAPQAETILIGNLVVDNDNPQAPEILYGFSGGGIAVGGGTKNLVVRNRVEGHDEFGIGLVGLNQFAPEGNTVDGNVLADNGVDLLYDPPDRATMGDNCFTGNTFTSSLPATIEQVMPCGGPAGTFDGGRFTPRPAPPGIDYRDVAAPADQPTMPDAATAPFAAASNVPPAVDLDAITVPVG